MATYKNHTRVNGNLQIHTPINGILQIHTPLGYENVRWGMNL